jgi:hypothetical protein
LEPGGIDTTLACRGALTLLWCFFVRKGVVWVFIVIVFGIVPAVCPAIFRVFLFLISPLTRRSSAA